MHIEKDITGAVIHLGDRAQQATMLILNAEAAERRPTERVGSLIGSQRVGEKDLAAHILLSLVSGFDIQELDQGHRVTAEAVFLHEEGHEDAIHPEHQV